MTAIEISNEQAAIQEELNGLLVRAQTLKGAAEKVGVDSSALINYVTVLPETIQGLDDLQTELNEAKAVVIQRLEGLPQLVDELTKKAKNLPENEMKLFKTETAKVFAAVVEKLG